MHTYTALYDDRADAEAVQAQLEKLGIVDADGTNLMHSGSAGFDPDVRSTHEHKGLWASVKGAFLPDHDRHLYEEGVKRGGYLLTVNVDDENADRVHEVLEGSNAVNVDEREHEYREAGYLPAVGAGLGGAAAAGGLAKSERIEDTGETRIPVVEEQLLVGKRQVERGGVRVRSYVTETPVSEQVNLRQEHVEVERRPVNEALTSAHGDVFKERDIAMTERGEEAVVAKEARVIEEVTIRKDVNEKVETVSDTVRKTDVDIERTDAPRDRI